MQKSILNSLFSILISLTVSTYSFAVSTTGTYSSGNIPTNLNSYSSSCNGPLATLSISIPSGSLVTGIDISYRMRSNSGAWISEQRSSIFCQETSNSESNYSGTGDFGGNNNYSRTGVSIANGITATGNLTFEMRAFRTWGGSGCGSSFCRINNNTWTITVNYLIIKSPGDISSTNLSLWLKADAQTSCTSNNCGISSWGDNTLNLNKATQNTSLNQPKFLVSSNNYNPGVNFEEPSQNYMSINDDNTLDLGNNHSVFIVTDLDAGVDGFISPISKHNDSYNNGGYGFHAFYSDASPYYNSSDLKTTYNVNINISAPSSTAPTIDAIIDGTPDITLAQYDGANISLTKNAGQKTSTPYTSNVIANSSPVILGADHDNLSVSSHYDGRINEVIIFDRSLSTNEQRKIETYLAVKYGITLDNTLGGTSGDYISTNGSLIWDASLTPEYHNDVISIARDDEEVLDQKQSKTYDDSTRIYISSLSNTNQLNSGIINNDGSYITLGHNNERLSSVYSAEKEAPAEIYSRILREWKVTNTNFSNDFSIEIKLEVPNTSINLADLRLLVDDDGDFTNATIISSPDVTFTLGSVIISGIGTAEIPLNSTRYITLASAEVTTPLPVAFLDFNVANINNKHSEISWTTASENNNSHFIIEKSQNTIDWKEVTKVNGANNSTETINYKATDLNPYMGVSYYRLKQVDYNGKFSYSQIRSVTFNKEDELLIFPNPTNGIITIQNKNILNKNIIVFNTVGQILTQELTINRSQNKAIIDLTKLATGNYIIKVNNTSYKVNKF